MTNPWYRILMIGVCLCLTACGRSEAVHLSSLKALPALDEFVAEYTGRDEVNMCSLSGGREFVWDLPIDPTLGRIQLNDPHSVAWSSGAHKVFLTTRTSAYLISTDGVANQLDLHMPGTLLPLNGMNTYSISPDGNPPITACKGTNNFWRSVVNFMDSPVLAFPGAGLRLRSTRAPITSGRLARRVCVRIIASCRHPRRRGS